MFSFVKCSESSIFNCHNDKVISKLIRYFSLWYIFMRIWDIICSLLFLYLLILENWTDTISLFKWYWLINIKMFAFFSVITLGIYRLFEVTDSFLDEIVFFLCFYCLFSLISSFYFVRLTFDLEFLLNLSIYAFDMSLVSFVSYWF